MTVVPGDLDTSNQPPMMVPLAHFVVGLGFLLVGILTSVGVAVGWPPGPLSLAHVHLLLVGWICVTIMGAMTQFIPVWSGVDLHSRRLSMCQLWLVTGGLLGFAVSLAGGRVDLLPAFGALMLVGFWTFVYNIGRTLSLAMPFDTTERHFALALGCFLLVTTFGLLLAIDLSHSVFAPLGLSRTAVVGAHATLAMFGAVLLTVVGALYQLATMFTQTELHGVDHHLKRLETWGYPLGVGLLASGRLVESLAFARLGGLLIAVALLGFAVILARRLSETQVDWTPMCSRYAVAAAALGAWALLALPAWLGDPLSPAALVGTPGTSYLLFLGVIGFVVCGTLYHVVPFIVWVRRYSDRLGYEPVPMIDELYDDRLAAADFWLFVAGTALLVGGDLGVGSSTGGVLGVGSSTLAAAGGVVLLAGAATFAANMGLVIRTHSQRSVLGLLRGTLWGVGGSTVEAAESTDES